MLLIAAISLQATSLREIVAPDSPLELIATGFQFTEGPAWLRDGRLVWSDIPADTIYSLKGDTLSVFARPSHGTNGNTLDSRGRLISCEHGGRRVSRMESNGGISVLVDRFDGKRLNSPNDAVAAADGTIYFTDPPYGIRPDQKELDFNGVFRIAPDGTVTVLAKDFDRPNGVALSPDEKTLYVSDTAKKLIRVFDLATGKNRVFAELKGEAPGSPDGLRVDKQGNVYSTGPGGIWVINPGGKILGLIAVPEVATNCGWGEPNSKTLFITAGKSVYRIRTLIPGLRH